MPRRAVSAVLVLGLFCPAHASERRAKSGPSIPFSVSVPRKASVPPLPAAAVAGAAASKPASAGEARAASAADAARAVAGAAAAPSGDAAGASTSVFDGKMKHVCAACAEGEGVSAAAALAPIGSGAGALPGDVLPARYRARLKLDPEAGTFSGSAVIEARVAKPTAKIELHAIDLDFTSVKVDGVVLDPKRVVVDALGERIALKLPKALKRGSVEIELVYAGKMNRLMRGLFQAEFRHGDAKETWAFTHLEPTHARRILPSFDEPRFKATFALTLDVPAHLTPLSNMPPAAERVEGGRRIVEFAETPKMSSYLMAVYAARLEAKTRRVGRTPVAVWAAPHQLGMADFALDVAENALKELERYFGVRYAMPKLDLVTSPEFASGAMENYGAVLFRDENVLVDPKTASETALRRVAEVVTHEIAHMWFGNLVTMKGWPDLWLNEAFATWLAAKIVDKWKPQWKVWEDFDLEKRAPLTVDALPGSRPIRSQARTSAEIQALFDAITYEKGGALLRMIETWLGEAKFRRGIQLYMKRYAEGNAEAADLWRELERASGKPVSRLGKGWLEQAGVPVVSVEAEPGDGKTLRLTQQRLSSLKALKPAQWIVPMEIRYKLEGEARARVQRVELSGKSAKVRLPGRGRLLWAYPNAAETGYYRLALSQPMLDAVLENKEELTPAERAGLLNHLWALTRAGRLPVDRFLAVLETFSEDRSRLVLQDAAGYLGELHDENAADDAERAALSRYAERFLAPHARRLGWTPAASDTEDDLMARPAVLGALVRLAPASPEAAKTPELVAAYLEDPKKVPGATASVALTAEARKNDPKLFEALLERLKEPRTPQQKNQVMRALAEFSEPRLLDRYLGLTLTPTILAQDGWRPFTWLLNNPATRAQAWTFVKRHWAGLVKKLGPRGATRIVAASSGLVSEKWRGEIEDFFGDDRNKVEMAAKSLEQAASSIELSLSFKQSQRAALARFAAGSR